MTLDYITDNINKKISENENIIIYTFFELRVKENLSEAEMYHFLSLVKTRLENLDYKTYRTGQKYEYDHGNKVVKENELLVAVKKPTNEEKRRMF